MAGKPDRRRRIDEIIRLLVALYLAPIPLEVAVGFVRRDEYDYRRVLVIVATITVLAVAVLVLRGRQRLFGHYVVGFWLVLIGMALTVLGVLLTLRGSNILVPRPWLTGIDTVLGAAAPTVGVLLIISGIYLIVERRRRSKRELDLPLPPDIASTRTRPLGKLTGATWQAPGFTQSRLIDLARAHLSHVDLHFVAFFDPAGECRFYVDVFDDDAVPVSHNLDSAERRSSYVRHGRHIRHLANQLNARVADLQTGRLVRVVLDVEQGAIYLYDLGTVGFLIGVTLDQEQVDPTDWKMSLLANALLRAHGRQEDDDFYRLCPLCGATNRSHPHSPAAQGTAARTVTNVVELRPRNGQAG
jgi:hypothetical protein